MKSITSLIPHRSPFLFVDAIAACSNEKIVGYKTFVEGEFFFPGHFPGYPIVPGVILVEALAQCGGAGIRSLNPDAEEQLFFLATVEKAKFRAPVYPNIKVRFEIENLKITSSIISQKGTVFLDEENKRAAEAQWMCIVSTKDKIS